MSWAGVFGGKRAADRFEPVNEFKLVEIRHPLEGGWEAHQKYVSADGSVEWRRLELTCGDIGVFWASFRAPHWDRSSATYAIEKARARFIEPEIVEHPV